MPSYSCLIILCGVPCTGKSLFAEQLKEALLNFRGGLVDGNSRITVHIAKDESPGVHKISQHSSGAAEKVARAHLKGSVERLLSLGGKGEGEGSISRGGGGNGGGGGGKSGGGSNSGKVNNNNDASAAVAAVESSTWNIVIADGLNYIKGYRYELYCIARTASAAYCCVWVGADAAVRTGGQETGIAKCLRLNAKRRKERGLEAGYDDKDLRDLYVRFEAPDDRNRWDSPLVRVIAAVLPDAGDGKNENENEKLSLSLSDMNVSGNNEIPSTNNTISPTFAPFLTSKFDLGTVLSATERSESSAVREQYQQQQNVSIPNSSRSMGTSVFSRANKSNNNNNRRRGGGGGLSHSSYTDVADLRDFEDILPSGSESSYAISGQEGSVTSPLPVKTTTVSSFKRAVRPVNSAAASAASAAAAASSRPQFEKIIEAVEETEGLDSNTSADNKGEQHLVAESKPLEASSSSSTTATTTGSTAVMTWDEGIASICGLTLGRGRASLMPVLATSSLPTFSSSSLAQTVAVTATVEASFVAALDAGLLKAGGTFTCEFGDQKPVIIKLKRLPKGSSEIRALRREFDRMSTDTVLCGSLTSKGGNDGLENFATFLEDSLSR